MIWQLLFYTRLWLWKSCLISLCLNFLIYIIRKTVISTWWSRCDNSLLLYIKPYQKLSHEWGIAKCSHEIKRLLLLGRKVMTNLHSILKSRDITLSKKFCLVKAMVFPVIMYGCEIQTIKKAECRRIDAFELWCQRRLFFYFYFFYVFSAYYLFIFLV